MARSSGGKYVLPVEEPKLTPSNLDKILYPAAHFMKGQVID
jgi:hypothetical protein